MKKLLIFSIIGILLINNGCSQGPDFSTPCQIKTIRSRKNYTGRKVFEYEIVMQGDNSVRGEDYGAIKFLAPKDFANVGDTIMYTNGVIKVVENN